MNDGSVCCCTCERCGAELRSAEKEFNCRECGVLIVLIWPADDYKGKKK